MNKVIYFLPTLFLLGISTMASGAEPYDQYDYGPRAPQGYRGEPNEPFDYGPRAPQGYRGEPNEPFDYGPRPPQGYRGEPYEPFDYGPRPPRSYSIEPYDSFDYGPQPHSRFSRDSGLQYEREQTEDSYILKIHLNDMQPSDIEIISVGNGLRIRSASAFRRENRDDRGGYSYISRSSSFSKYIRVPRDADIDRLQKTVSDGMIMITIPKSPNYYYRY